MHSPLAYQVIPMTPTHYTYRTRPIDAVVIHYTASIVREARDTVRYWESNDPYQGANYIIDVTGRITSVVPEERRAYTSSSYFLGNRDIDDHAITIECSCNYVPPDINDSARYLVSDDTINACVNLVADIGARYGIDLWIFTGDESGNVHAHKWYGATPCPGAYLYNHFGEIAGKANTIMEVQKPMTQLEREEFDALSRKVDKIATAVDKIYQIISSHTEVQYNSINDVPNWAYKEISYLMEFGYLKGTEAGLQLNTDTLRTLCVLARALMPEDYVPPKRDDDQLELG